MNSNIEEVYVDNCNLFKIVCVKFSKFLEYVESIIFGPVKEKVVRFWTNRVKHLGNTMANRAEYVHKRLKKYMYSSMNDLCTNWASVHNMLESQRTHIHMSFQKIMIMFEHGFKGNMLWSKLVRNILRNTLHFLADKTDRAVRCDWDKSKCSCLIFITN